MLRVRCHHQQLVSPDACQGIGGAQLGTGSSGDQPQVTIADFVSEPVIHNLESINVDIDDGQLSRLVLCLLDGAIQAAFIQTPIWQTGQGVVS